MKTFPSRLALHEAHKVIRDLVNPIIEAMMLANTADSDGSPLVTNWSSSHSVFGYLSTALDEITRDYYGLSIYANDGIQWCACSDFREDYRRFLCDNLIKA